MEKFNPQLRMEIDLHVELQLEDPEEQALLRALDLWYEKPQQKIDIPLNRLQEILTGGNKTCPEENNNLEISRLISETFVLLTPEEMTSIDPDEKVGLSKGDLVFVSDNTPEEYIPFVVMNLALLRRLKNDNAFSKYFESYGISVDEARHWSANIIDIMAAEYQFADEKTKFAKYLEWRKKMERTDFFENPLVDEFIRKRVSYLDYKRTTHPAKRGKYGGRSWNLSRGFKTFSNEFVDRNAGLMLISKVDILAQRLAEADEFDPEAMIELCANLHNFITSEKVSAKRRMQQKIVNLDGYPDLDRQAYLLSNQGIGGENFAPLIVREGGTNSYILKPSAQLTIKALADRIAYFYREAIKKLDSGQNVTQDMIHLLNSPHVTLGFGHEISEISIDLNSIDSLEQIEINIALNKSKIDQIEEILRRFEDLEAKMSNMTTSDLCNITPAIIKEDKESLIRVKEMLMRQIEQLENAQIVARDIKSLRGKSKALLSNVVMDNSHERIIA